MNESEAPQASPEEIARFREEMQALRAELKRTNEGLERTIGIHHEIVHAMHKYVVPSIPIVALLDLISRVARLISIKAVESLWITFAAAMLMSVNLFLGCRTSDSKRTQIWAIIRASIASLLFVWAWSLTQPAYPKGQLLAVASFGFLALQLMNSEKLSVKEFVGQNRFLGLPYGVLTLLMIINRLRHHGLST